MRTRIPDTLNENREDEKGMSETTAAEPRVRAPYSVKKSGWKLYLHYGDMARQDIEWLGVIRRDRGSSGALGRLKETGELVQVNAGNIRVLDQQQAAQALEAAA